MSQEINYEPWKIVPITPLPVDLPVEPFSPCNKCPACGLELKPVMMYVCPRNPCPVGLGSMTMTS